METLQKSSLVAQDLEDPQEFNFNHLAGEVYLDHAGATIYSRTQLVDFHKDLLANLYGNPHSKNNASKKTAKVIEEVRARTLQHFNTTSKEYSVIFVQNCSAAMNLVATSFNFHMPDHSTEMESDVDGVSFLKSEVTQELCHPSQRIQSHLCENHSGCGVLAYLNDNHTSVIGMRGSVNRNCCQIVCITKEDVLKEVQSAGDILKSITDKSSSHKSIPNNLFVYPAQSNFSGERYPLEWTRQIQRNSNFLEKSGNWRVFLDSASFLTTSTLDLSIFQPDFVGLSFYKIFGFPTGLGCLLVKNESQSYLKKNYFGGGTINILLPSNDTNIFRINTSERFEDGTLPYFEILAVKHGFQSLTKLFGGMSKISNHSFALAQFTFRELKKLRYDNNQKVVELYHANEFEDVNSQGPIVNFNIMKCDGSYVGFSQVEEMSKLYNISLRTGCFCNIGACQKYLNISSERIMNNYNAGHVCGDDMDLIQGHPTGSVRISFAASSTISDADYFLNFIRQCFLHKGNINLKCNLETETKPMSDQGYRLEEIWIYPIKSCSGTKVEKSIIDKRGLKYDRKWMIVNQSGKCLTQKQIPHMCKIKCFFKTDELEVSCEGFPSLILTCDNKNKMVIDNQIPCIGKVCRDRISGVSCGTEAEEWFSKVLNVSQIQLIRQCSTDLRKLKKGYDVSLSFSNEGQFLLVGTASLKKLCDMINNKEVNSNNEPLLNIDHLTKRFRPNFVVHTNIPFEEETWHEIQIGQDIFQSIGLCNRCKMICLDQSTGFSSPEPLLTLMSIPKRKATFGILLVHDRKGGLSLESTIQTGDCITVLK